MSFFVNIGYQFAIPPSVHPAGSIILCSAMPMHQLVRRRIDERYPHPANRYFDPQLYLASLDPASCRKHCTVLSSYPWFGAEGTPEYDSGEQTQAQWRNSVQQMVHVTWPRAAPTDPNLISDVVRTCIDFQLDLGCAAIILPSPLTVDPGSDYSLELRWLDAGLDYARNGLSTRVPVFATVAISDICLRFVAPSSNYLLDVIADTVSARGVDGAYLVLEQSGEPSDTRHCASTLPLASMLHLARLFSEESGIRVGVNFMGFFGLACEAVGAEFWASGWYKSLYRFRLADRMTAGRAYPTYWSYPAATDIHLENDFQILNEAGLVSAIADPTSAAQGLLRAARAGTPPADVPAWRYAQSNVAATQEHFLISAVNAEASLMGLPPAQRLDHIQRWLSTAANHAASIAALVGPSGRTKTAHVQAWLDAYSGFRSDHNV